jgi:hypothetical protein
MIFSAFPIDSIKCTARGNRWRAAKITTARGVKWSGRNRHASPDRWSMVAGGLAARWAMGMRPVAFKQPEF